MPRRNLYEAVEVDGAVFIGNGKGYDLFDITTYEAAQEFNIENTANPAGASYVHDERTFNQNINDQQHLYFFALEDTNRVFGAVVKSDRTTGIIEFHSANGNANISVEANFMFENAAHNSYACYTTLPFYLIPGADFTNVSANGCLIQDNMLMAAIGSLTPETAIDLTDLPDNVTDISADSDAFNYGLHVDSIYLNPNFYESNITRRKLAGIENIKVQFTSEDETPANWDRNWNEGKNVEYGYGLNPDEIAQRQAETAERIRQERIRREEEARRREEEEAARRRAEEAEREARRREEEERRRAEERARTQQLRYRIEGKGVTILGARPGATRIDIPAEIEGKPVTKIAANAFAFSDIEQVKLPSTLKLIEKEAFYGADNLRGTVYIPAGCIVGKNAFRFTTARISR